ncbi:MAG: phage head closure protein [Hyphomicrobium sp.]|jgi:SPP1 family predicted phage head-tail adaptor|nr:phage head closure protein [Hyphomicrobium sp.]
MSPTTLAAMRHRLALESMVPVPDGAGGSISSWAHVSPVWARIRPLSGSEVSDAGGLAGRVSHEITIRYRDDVAPPQRFRLGSRIFDIKAVIDEREAHRFLICLVEERVP